MGNVLGSIYENIVHFYGEGVGVIGQELADLDKRIDKMEGLAGKVTKTAKSLEEKRSTFWQKVFGIEKDDQEEWRAKYDIKKDEDKNEIHPETYSKNNTDEQKDEGTRRNFLYSLLEYAHQHPRTTGTVVGGSYGGIRMAKGGFKDYRTASKNEERDEKIGELERQTKEFEQKIKELTGTIASYEHRLKTAGEEKDKYGQNIAKIRTQLSELTVKYADLLSKYSPASRDTPKDNDNEKEDKDRKGKPMAMFIGLVLLAASLTLSLTKPITASVIGNIATTNNLISVSLFVLSLLFLYFGVKK